MAGPIDLRKTDFLRILSWQVYLLLRVFARNLLRGNRRRNNFFVFCFDVWPGVRVPAFTSNKSTHYLLDYGGFNMFLKSLSNTAFKGSQQFRGSSNRRCLRGLQILQRRIGAALHVLLPCIKMALTLPFERPYVLYFSKWKTVPHHGNYRTTLVIGRSSFGLALEPWLYV